jgi:hypothetical protein
LIGPKGGTPASSRTSTTRRLGADHDQIHVLGRGQGEHRRGVGGLDIRHAADLGLLADGVTPRRHDDDLYVGLAGEAPDQGVLPTAAA